MMVMCTVAAPLDNTTTAYTAKQPTIGILYIVLASADMIIVFVSLIMLFGVEPVTDS